MFERNLQPLGNKKARGGCSGPQLKVCYFGNYLDVWQMAITSEAR